MFQRWWPIIIEVVTSVAFPDTFTSPSPSTRLLSVRIVQYYIIAPGVIVIGRSYNTQYIRIRIPIYGENGRPSLTDPSLDNPSLENPSIAHYTQKPTHTHTYTHFLVNPFKDFLPNRPHRFRVDNRRVELLTHSPKDPIHTFIPPHARWRCSGFWQLTIIRARKELAFNEDRVVFIYKYKLMCICIYTCIQGVFGKNKYPFFVNDFEQYKYTLVGGRPK